MAALEGAVREQHASKREHAGIEDIPTKRRTRRNAEFLNFFTTPITMKNSNHNQSIDEALIDLRL